MKQISPIVRRYLDMEAQVDVEGLSEDEDDEAAAHDLEDPFIDDGLDVEDDAYPRPSSSEPIRSLTTLEIRDRREEAWSAVIARIETREDAPHGVSKFLQSYGSAETTVEERIGYLPRADDYPLWKVECRIGLEDVAVVSLLSRASQRHRVGSAFTRGSIHGSIYVEGIMDQDLVALLMGTPGILRNQQGLKRQMIDLSEYVELLKMKNTKVDVEVGSWVLVKKGLYKGDVGLVSRTSAWGVRVLLVPRLGPPSRQDRKQKASTIKPDAKIFDPDEARRILSANVARKTDGSYSLGLLEFEHGLLIKDFDYFSVTNEVRDIPHVHFSAFRSSQHPDVVQSHMPRPREWSLNENDKILIRTSYTSDEPYKKPSTWVPAILKSLDVYNAEAERWEVDGGQELCWTLQVSWQDVRKCIEVGEYISVSSGPFAGYTGWAVAVEGDQVTAIKKTVKGEISQEVMDSANAVESFAVCVNLVEVSTQISSFQIPPSLEFLLKPSIRHPWCGLHVLIVKHHHPRKGDTGEIKEVIEQYQGGEGIRLNIQLTRYDPSAPFQRISVDYGDVVESSSLNELARFLDPGPKFRRPQFRRPEIHLRHVVSDDASGSSTPAYSQTSSTPAWDPSSGAPYPWLTSFRDCDFNPQNDTSVMREAPSDQNSAAPAPQHVLLNPKLVGIKLNVLANGGEYRNKMLVASTALVDDNLVLRSIKYHTSTLLNPDWITPKYPNPIHDNGLLVVIKGDHCGKYARRIRHQRGSEPMKILVAAVTRSDNARDILTGERLELEIESLCTVTESKKEKDINWNIMHQIRGQYKDGTL